MKLEREKELYAISSTLCLLKHYSLDLTNVCQHCLDINDKSSYSYFVQELDSCETALRVLNEIYKEI